jgi:hypothetical protein
MQTAQSKEEAEVAQDFLSHNQAGSTKQACLFCNPPDLIQS